MNILLPLFGLMLPPPEPEGDEEDDMTPEDHEAERAESIRAEQWDREDHPQYHQ